jgi:RNA 3'-terminal phosphate cyclase (GTP)
MIKLDGSHGEGGGQILRHALVWSLLTSTPFRIEKIRAARKFPGLKAQHVAVLEALKPLGPIGVEGGTVGSDVLEFQPAPLQAANYRVDVGSAGSIPLILQTLVPAFLLAKGCSRVELTGGTDVRWAPSMDYLRNVALWPSMKHAWQMRLDVLSRGFYPKGGGRVVFEAAGWKESPPLELGRRGRMIQIRLVSVASELLRDRQVAERQAEAAAALLRPWGVGVHLETCYAPSVSPGSVLTAVADFAGGQKLGASSLGSPGVPAESVGAEAAEQLLEEIRSEAPVDRHAADQLVLWLILAGGVMHCSRITEHTRTAIWLSEHFVGKRVEIDGSRLSCVAPFPFHFRPSC